MTNEEIIANWESDGIDREWYAVESLDGSGTRRMLYVGSYEEAMADVAHRMADRAEYYATEFYNVSLIAAEDAYRYFSGLWADLHASQLSVAEAAEALGVNRQRVHQLIRDGKVSAAKIGGTWIVDGASVQARIESKSNAFTSRDWAKLGHDIALFYDAWRYGANSPSAASLADDFDDVRYVLDVDATTLKRRAASYFIDPSVAEWVEHTMPYVDWDYIIED